MRAIDDRERRQFLSFSLAGSDYGIPILHVREILQFEAITRIPALPPSIRGVINLRGSVVPVVDLALKFGLAKTPVTQRTCVLVAEVSLGGQPTVMGVLADGVSEVLELRDDEIEPPPPFGSRVQVEYLIGMGKVGKGFVLLLDLDRALAADEKAVNADRPAWVRREGSGPAFVNLDAASTSSQQ